MPAFVPRRKRAADDPKMIGHWKVGRIIGTGAQGRVRIARHSKTGEYAAIKIISKFPTGSQLLYEAGHAQHSVEREIVIMKLINHPNIMQLYDVWETSADLYLIMEYVEGGELFDYLCNREGPLSTAEALGYFQQIISAVHYCHRFNIAHRDLKPENLLLDQNKNIKLADFGLAAYGANDGMLETFCGSPHYAAPEVIAGQVYNGSCSDTWSCGVILHALLTGRLPFNEDNNVSLRKKILAAEFTMPEDIDPLAKDLLSKMLEKDVTKRIPISEVLCHPFYMLQKREGADHVIPELETIAQPIESFSSIDPNIFANLRTLWPNSSVEEIVDCLRNDDKNWQKGIYHLLMDYRSRYLENYEEEVELEHRVSRRSKKAKKSETPLQEIRETCLETTDLVISRSSLPPRAAPPTPRRASRENGRPTSTASMECDDSSLPGYCIAPGTTLHSLSPYNSPSVSPTSPLSPRWAALNDLPPLEVPELEDEKMRQFFHQIVDHLNAMQHMASVSPNPDLASAPVSTPADVEIDQRVFLDDAYSTEDVTNAQASWRSPEVTHGLRIFNDRDLTRPLKVQRPKRPAYEIPVARGAEKENEDEGFLIVDRFPKKSSLRKNGTVLGDKKVHIVEPETERGKLKKKKGTVASNSPVISGAGPLPSSPSPKRTWFDSVFRFKPASYELSSVHDALTSRGELRRLLTELGAQVMLTNAEGEGVLRCKLEEVRDPVGAMAVMKAVRFRVEVRCDERSTGYATTLRFVQEKGSMSSFKAVFGRVQRDWELDVPAASVRIRD